MDLPERYEYSGNSFNGGMAGVHECVDRYLERKVAIKILPKDYEQRRLLDELRALLRLRSKHVVQVYDLFNLPNGDLAIVQEFVDGCDLLDASTTPPHGNAFLLTCWQIATGIADIHAQGVIHRDIKPNNMKVDGEGVLRIFDFGLARDNGPSAVTLGFAGTVGFAAPELYVAPATFTSAIDTYAFGATAIFLFLRSLPAEMMQLPPKPPATNPFPDGYIPEELARIILQCVAPAPGDRPDMRDVRNLLAKYLLHGRHKALLVWRGHPHYLGATSSTAKISHPLGSIEIAYDNLRFFVKSTLGNVFINSAKAVANDTLPGSCVVALGGPEYGPSRQYLTFDVSHPEVIV